MTPRELKEKFPLDNTDLAFISKSREIASDIINGNNLNFGFLSSESTKICDEIDPLSTKRIAEGAILEGKEDQDRVKIVDSERIKPKVQVNNKSLAIIAGPCSVHDLDSFLEYAEKFKKLSEELSPQYFLVLRAYVEKSRTSTGWRGLVYDPDLDGSCDIEKGLTLSRRLFTTLTKMRLPIAMEFVDPNISPYLKDLVTWGFVGARNAFSQVHRQLAAILEMPVGFKNSLEGSIDAALNSILCQETPQSFLFLDDDGRIKIVKNIKNNFPGHLVLRGSIQKPNFDLKLPHRLIIDCSHGNLVNGSQIPAFKTVLNRLKQGDQTILGIMLESNLKAEKQPLDKELEYGVSITDPCLDFETTKELLKLGF